MARVQRCAADNDHQTERQVDTDDLSDAIEAGAGPRPGFKVDGTSATESRSDTDAAIAKVSRAEVQLITGYAPFPKFVPTRVTNFGNTTSRSAAGRSHAYA
jgi:hypothetical protein